MLNRRGFTKDELYQKYLSQGYYIWWARARADREWEEQKVNIPFVESGYSEAEEKFGRELRNRY